MEGGEGEEGGVAGWRWVQDMDCRLTPLTECILAQIMMDALVRTLKTEEVARLEGDVKTEHGRDPGKEHFQKYIKSRGRLGKCTCKRTGKL